MSRNQRRNRRNKPGGSQNARATHPDGTGERSVEAERFRSSTETKSSLRTTELIAYAGAVLAVVMTALALDDDGQGGGDPFGAEPAIRYITYLTIGYMVARGLAKSGSHENRVDHDLDADLDSAPRTVVVDDEDGRDTEPDGADVTDAPADEPSDRVPAASAGVDAKP